MSKKVILLVEVNPDDEELTLRALEDYNVVNEVVDAMMAAMERADFVTTLGDANICPDLDAALERARVLLGQS